MTEGTKRRGRKARPPQENGATETVEEAEPVDEPPQPPVEDDERKQFLRAKKTHQKAYVNFCQIVPTIDHNIDPRPISSFQDFSDMVRYLRDSHWKGKMATYQYKIYDSGQSEWGVTGQINFGADPKWAAQRNGHEEEDVARRDYPHGYPPPYPPQYGAPPGYPPSPYGVPPGYPPPGYPPPQYYPPPPQAYPQPQPPPQPGAQPPQPAPPPMPMPPPPATSDMQIIVQYLIEQNKQLVNQYAQLFAQMQWQEQHGRPPGVLPGMLPPQYAVGGAPQPPPPPPKNMFEQMREVADTMREVTKLTRSLAEEHAPAEPEKPPEKPPEDMPFKIQELPHMRFVTTKDGQPVDHWTTFMFNGDRIKDAAKGMFDEFKGMMKQRNDDAEQERQRTLAAMEKAVELRRQMSAPAAAPPVQQQAPAGWPSAFGNAGPQRGVPPAHNPPVQQPISQPQPNARVSHPEPVTPAATAARSFGAVGRPKVVETLKPVPEPVIPDEEPPVQDEVADPPVADSAT